MPRGRDGLLQVEAAVAERGLGLERGRAVRRLELLAVRHEAHALAAAPGRGLQQHRIADVVGGCTGLVECRRAFRAGNDGHARVAHLGLGLDLVAHSRHHLRARPDEDEVVVGARLDKRGILREEAVAWMNGLAAGRGRGGDDRRDPQVALGRLRRADADRAVREAHVQGVAVDR